MDITLFLILVIGVVFIVLYWGRYSSKSQEGFHGSTFSDYVLMSRLPWVTPPMSIGSLGGEKIEQVKQKYPGLKFSTADVPISVPPDGVRIYETGNTYNPNVHSYIGLIEPPDLRW